MRKLLLTALFAILSVSVIAQDTVNSTASFYHSKYNGRKTTSGEVYNEQKPSAASNDYPLGTTLLIINKTTGQTVTVVVNDRMAKYIHNRIDLSKFAFKQIASLDKGLQKVHIVRQML